MAIEEEASLNLGTTLGINAAAAIMTVVGGGVVFSSKLLRAASPLVLAFMLGLSGGVTLFIALVTLFANSFSEFSDSFTNSTRDEDEVAGDAWLSATAAFGGGILISYLIDFLVQKLTPGQNPSGTIRTQNTEADSNSLESPLDTKTEIRPPVEFIQDPGMDIFIRMDESAKEKLQAMGILSAIAVGIHNIPEGMATFVASSEHAYIGMALAIGVGLHNVAEGIAIAAPIYFATGSRTRAVLWCFWSAIAQQIGGWIAFAAMGMDADNFSQAILYGLSSGMIVGIAIKELIPTAYTYANGRMHLVSAGALGGTFLMAACLIFFKFIGV